MFTIAEPKCTYTPTGTVVNWVPKPTTYGIHATRNTAKRAWLVLMVTQDALTAGDEWVDMKFKSEQNFGTIARVVQI